MAADPAAVWGLLADFGSISAWAGNVDHSCLLQQVPGGGPGTSRRVQVGRTTLVERITDYQPGTTLGYDIEGLPRRLGRIANRWTLADRGADTVVTLTSTVDVGDNPLARAVGGVLCRAMGKQSDALLRGLAEAAERKR